MLRGEECEHVLPPPFFLLLLSSIFRLHNIPWKQTLYAKQLSKEVTFTFHCMVAY